MGKLKGLGIVEVNCEMGSAEDIVMMLRILCSVIYAYNFILSFNHFYL